MKKPPCAACASKDAERIGLLRELTRTDKEWRDMVLLLEQQLGDARGRMADLEACVRRQQREITELKGKAARATAVLAGRDHCIPEDVVENVLPVCAHRVVSKTAMHEGDTITARRIMQRILETVPSPV